MNDRKCPLTIDNIVQIIETVVVALSDAFNYLLIDLSKDYK